ncbi:MAG: hypothetical protein J6T00_01005 [Bacteroidaceae bacterium]|nr:hypothetical protein [Bacteroidaceae bacterium]
MEKRKYSQWKFIATFVVVMGMFAGVRYAFGIEVRGVKKEVRGVRCEVREVKDEVRGVKEEVREVKDEMRGVREEVVDSVDSIPSNSENSVKSPMSGGAHRVRGVWSYSACFPDSQNVQIEAAQKYGIMPVRNRKEAERLVKQHRLVNICHSPFYAIDELTHSIPYLVPRAQHLLNTICLNFIDSCQVKGLPIHLPIVTSVLRTTDDVSNLQRGNKNATTNSCHCYGTTVDIAYNKFMPMTGTYESKATLFRWNEPMKQVLSEVLNDLRMEGKCYVKYERKQGCFHLTCR